MMMGARTRLAAAGLLGMVALATVSVPVAEGASPGCHVRNATQGTASSSFVAMVKAAHRGDTIHVRGLCEGGVRIGMDLTLIGVGHRRPTLTGRDRHGILWIDKGARVALRHLDIARGSKRSIGRGGAILNRGHLSLDDSVVRHSRGDHGGGIWSGGKLVVIRSLVRRNTAVTEGGGIMSVGSLRLEGTVVRDNRAALAAGIENRGRARLVRSVVRANRSVYYAGGIDNNGSDEGTLELIDSVLRDNRTEGLGGGIVSQDGTITLGRSVLRGNQGSDGGGIYLHSGVLRLQDGSSIRGNTAASGGGIFNADATVSISPDSSVTGNTPDDCVGTAAC